MSLPLIVYLDGIAAGYGGFKIVGEIPMTGRADRFRAAATSP